MTEPNDPPTGDLRSRVVEDRVFLDPDEQVSLRELALVPWKRKLLVGACVLVCGLLAILVCVLMHPKYKATALIELNEDKGGGSDLLSSMASFEGGGVDDLKVKIETESAVIKDDSIALAVLGKMGKLRLANPDRFSKEPGPFVSAEALPAERREELIGNFEGHLKVGEVGSSRLIAITFVSRDPVDAAQVANQVVAEYRSYLLNSNFNSSKEVSQWLSAQLGDLSNQVTKTQQATEDFERAHNLSSAMLGLSTLSGGGASSVSGDRKSVV